MMQENGLINHWFGEQMFNMSIKNNLTANNHFSNVMDCMADVFQTEKEIPSTKTQFHKVTLNGLRFLFYAISGGFSLYIVVLLSEIAAIIWLNDITSKFSNSKPSLHEEIPLYHRTTRRPNLTFVTS